MACTDGLLRRAEKRVRQHAGNDGFDVFLNVGDWTTQGDEMIIMMIKNDDDKDDE